MAGRTVRLSILGEDPLPVSHPEVSSFVSLGVFLPRVVLQLMWGSKEAGGVYWSLIFFDYLFLVCLCEAPWDDTCCDFKLIKAEVRGWFPNIRLLKKPLYQMFLTSFWNMLRVARRGAWRGRLWLYQTSPKKEEYLLSVEGHRLCTIEWTRETLQRKKMCKKYTWSLNRKLCGARYCFLSLWSIMRGRQTNLKSWRLGRVKPNSP